MPRPIRTAALSVALLLAAGAGVADDAAVSAGNLSGSLTFEHDRDAAEALAEATRELAAGQTTAGLSRLQQLLDRSEDVLIEDGNRYVSAWEAANDILSRLANVERTSYEQLTEDASRSELELASSPIDQKRLARLTIRYRHNTVGTDAAVLLAALAFDRGDWKEASAWCQLARRLAVARPLPPGLERLQDRLDERVPLSSTNDRATPSVSPADTMTTTWRHELDVDPKAARAIDLALADYDAQAMTPVLSARPLVVEGRVIVRNLRGLACLDAATGRLLWKHKIDNYASRLARGPGELDNPVRLGQLSATFLRRLIRDSLQDELASNGEFVYAVITGERPRDADPSLPFNRLRAIEIAAGETVWEAGPPPPSRKRFARKPDPRFFLGPPLIDGRQLLVLAQRRASIELVALDPTDGESLWAMPVGQAVRDVWPPAAQNEDAPPYDRERQSTACLLSRDGSRVLCSTAAGAVVCVDLLSRRVLWAHRYARGDLPRHPPAQGDATHFREMPVRDSFARAECMQVAGVGLCVAPDADRLFAFDLDVGDLLWSRPRGDGIQLLLSETGDPVLVGEGSVCSLSIHEGTERWNTPIPRPAGTGFVTGDTLIVPLESGGRLSVRLTDGTVIDSPFNIQAENEPSFTIAAHPPTGMRSMQLRNLRPLGDSIVSQSPTVVERVTLPESVPDESSAGVESLASSLMPLLQFRSTLEPSVDVVRSLDSRVMLADHLLLTVLEGAGLRQSVEQQAARLVQRLEQLHATNHAVPSEETRRQLESLHPAKLYLTTADGMHSCRLDRWIDGQFPQESDSTKPAGQASSNTVDASVVAGDAWPTTLPTVTEKKTHFGEPHFLRVPMQAGDDSAWRDVSVEIDRLGRMVQFSTAERIVPMAVSLPPETGVVRSEVDFLRAWGAGNILLLRVGLELVAFEMKPDGNLPDAPHWPSRGTTLPLAGPNPPLATSIREVGDEIDLGWNHTSAGWEDVFGRRLGEVGPVCDDYFCYQDRGHLIALDTRTGGELWRRSRLPVGTCSIGDKRHVVLFRADSPVVTVLDALDGRTLKTWRLDESEFGSAAPGLRRLEPHLVNGTAAALMLPTAEGGQWHCLEMVTGQSIWQFDASAGAHVFAVSETLLGVAEKAEAGRHVVTFRDWPTGSVVGRQEVQGPQELADVVTFRDADQMYVILSGKITDLRLLNARQILSGADRRSVNGWLHAFRIDDAAHLWSQPVENMAFPTVQPRHVPLLLINDQVHPADQSIPQGRLICLDKRTGQTVASLTDTLHINYTLEPDAAAGRIDVRMRGRTLRLDYGTVPQ